MRTDDAQAGGALFLQKTCCEGKLASIKSLTWCMPSNYKDASASERR